MSTPYDPQDPYSSSSQPQPPSNPGQQPPPPGYSHQPPAPGYSQQPPQRPASERKGLAITALVLGIVALLGCWIPILNFGSIGLGLIGVVLGVVALVQVSKGRAGGKVMAIVGTALSAVAIVLSIVVNVFLFSVLEEQAPAIQDEIERQLEEDGFSDEEIDELLGG
ncbi:hypothetical protein GCM10023216_29970 [Isoptericola chiayiensis]|uniref:DUF4190 domain-containing protein n=1 Tax=Isoptericola chiayiensis TaxID=579446 RepID=A0ABP8YN72_9MICO|nr:DUF4190 domain-containing protein [Isoptericola chiayiensis]NOW01847.1 hypothetical protein [Isoptericola chiayiensis]